MTSQAGSSTLWPQTVPSPCTAAGDVILVRIGDIVPADIKLLGDEKDTSNPLQVDQAALTGESLPVKKFPGHIAFSGSTIKQGEQEALVYATGANTFFGRAAALIAGTNAVANIQKVQPRSSSCQPCTCCQLPRAWRVMTSPCCARSCDCCSLLSGYILASIDLAPARPAAVGQTPGAPILCRWNSGTSEASLHRS